MTEFELFNNALKEYEQSTSSNEECEDKNTTKCKHKNINNERGLNICTECGLQLRNTISHNKEWRYYGQSDNRHSSDPNRVIIRKDPESNIFKDVENMGFSDKIIEKANIIYKQVTNNKIFRNNSRKSIIFACIYHSYKLNDKPQTHQKLIEIFGLDNKTALKGLKHVNLNAPKSSNILTTYITPDSLITDIMEKFQGTQSQIDEVIVIYNKIKNKSSRINRSRPLSVSSSVVYYWILKTKKDISLKDFISKIELSDLTVSKLSKEIARVMGDTNLK